jgi:hypothetical protein
VFLVDIQRQFQPDSLTIYTVVSGGQFVSYALYKRKFTKNDPDKLQTTQTLKF